MIVNMNTNRDIPESYEKIIQYLFEQLPVYQRDGVASYKIDLARTLEMDEWFHHPHKVYRSIHVAGTNGKGSVAHMLASILMETGLKVGLYTSPHLKDFRERIRVNGKPLPANYVVNYVEKNLDFFEKLKPSFFELTVFMALTYFQREQVDVAVIETGLGGRLDSTNILVPDLSVITNIGHDHSEYLGDTLAQVAAEKAGIIKPGIPVVVGETQPEAVNIFEKIAMERGSDLVFADQRYKIEYALMTIDQKQRFKIRDLSKHTSFEVDTDLLGMYQRKNLVTVLQAIDILCHTGYGILPSAVNRGLEKAGSSTGLMGRWQIIRQHPLVICDTGHNREGINEVVEQIKNTPYKKLHIVLGLVKEKNHLSVLKLLPKRAHYYFTKAGIPRALNEQKLAALAHTVELKGLAYPTVKAAYSAALSAAGKDDMIFVGGSTFVVAEVL